MTNLLKSLAVHLQRAPERFDPVNEGIAGTGLGPHQQTSGHRQPPTRRLGPLGTLRLNVDDRSDGNWAPMRPPAPSLGAMPLFSAAARRICPPRDAICWTRKTR
jgi:hypothetical protein